MEHIGQNLESVFFSVLMIVGVDGTYHRENDGACSSRTDVRRAKMNIMGDT